MLPEVSQKSVPCWLSALVFAWILLESISLQVVWPEQPFPGCRGVSWPPEVDRHSLFCAASVGQVFVTSLG